MNVHFYHPLLTLNSFDLNRISDAFQDISYQGIVVVILLLCCLLEKCKSLFKPANMNERTEHLIICLHMSAKIENKRVQIVQMDEHTKFVVLK